MAGLLNLIDVTLRGAIPLRARQYAIAKISTLMHLAPAPVSRARIKLTRTHHRSGDEHVIAEAMLDMSGRPVRAQVAAGNSHEAIDLMQYRLRRKLSRLARHRSNPDGRERPHRPGYTRLPPAEREVVRHKTYEPVTATPDDAAWDMELMDYDFQLFTDAESGWDSMVFRNGQGSYGLACLPEQPRLTLRAAIDTMEATELSYLFYRDAGSGRGNVLYRRYDGNYGLITPA